LLIAGSEVTAFTHTGGERGRILLRTDIGSGPPGSDSSHPLRRATFAWDAILLPIRGALLTISPSDGRLISRTLWDFAGGGGNLLLTSNLLAVTNPEGVLIYGDRARERAWIDALPADQTETLLERTKFHFKVGEIRGPRGCARVGGAGRRRHLPTRPSTIQLDLALMLQ
jgi:hypothetical protein